MAMTCFQENASFFSYCHKNSTQNFTVYGTSNIMMFKGKMVILFLCLVQQKGANNAARRNFGEKVQNISIQIIL